MVKVSKLKQFKDTVVPKSEQRFETGKAIEIVAKKIGVGIDCEP